MKAILQRVRSACVSVQGKCISAVGPGLLILIGVTREDDEQAVLQLASKVVGLRIFEDQDGKMNLSVGDAGGEALVVSQFTLYADCRKGRRPSFTNAAPPEIARHLYERFCDCLRREGISTSMGAFGEKMMVALENDGPVTIVLDTALL
ncbi:MAG: D-tyrosyl-tRNA(Tyr) deacylase [Candidatus Coatesbacteria bacterium]|nr:D-tyrosyl-tRNA(Tyr) deacylase [Candidatus Coatesbacteria bacterium]